MPTQKNIRIYLNNNDIASKTTWYRNSEKWGVQSITRNELCFTANTALSSVQLTMTWSPTSVSLEYCTDNITRDSYTIWNTIILPNVGDKVYFRNTSTTDTWFSTDGSNYYKFIMTWSINWSWDVNYLLNKNSTTTLSNTCFLYLFHGCSSLKTAPELPATTLATNCYSWMFRESWITETPILPATTLVPWCYSGMFSNCNSLIKANSLPATTATERCYSQMFEECANLTTWPSILPATTLAGDCYMSMFQWCSSLTNAPILPATTLASYCYARMFDWCTSLITPPALPATTLARSCYDMMFCQCSNLESLPALPATTLARECYEDMFEFCYKIKLSTTQTGEYQTPYRIPTSWEWTDDQDALDDMFYSTWWSFTWTPTINTTYYTSNTIIS